MESLETYKKRIEVGIKKSDSIEVKIEKLKEHGHKYSMSNMQHLLSYIHKKTKEPVVFNRYPTKIELLRKTVAMCIQQFPENDTFGHINNLLDRFNVDTETIQKNDDLEYVTLFNTVTKNIDSNFLQLIAYITGKEVNQEGKNFSLQKFVAEIDNIVVTKLFDFLESQKDYKFDETVNYDVIIAFARSQIHKIASVIPSSILNKHTKNELKVFKKYIDSVKLESKLKLLQSKANVYIELFENTSYLSEYSIMDLKLVIPLYTYYFLLFCRLFDELEIESSVFMDFITCSIDNIDSFTEQRLWCTTDAKKKLNRSFEKPLNEVSVEEKEVMMEMEMFLPRYHKQVFI